MDFVLLTTFAGNICGISLSAAANRFAYDRTAGINFASTAVAGLLIGNCAYITLELGNSVDKHMPRRVDGRAITHEWDIKSDFRR